LQSNGFDRKVAATLLITTKMPEGEAVQDLPLFSGAQSNSIVHAERRPAAALVGRIVAGDEEAFSELYRMFAPTINAVVLARVPRDEVQDIVQEVFIAAYRSMAGLKDANLVGPWLIRIARNRAAEFYRSYRASEELDEQISRPQERSREAAEILKAIRALGSAYSETLIMRLVEGMTAKEIAERTGLKPESVRVNLHRGMEKLRESLGVEKRK
jgi:RNA polymerase sigma-70 factor (ECF subfamily)